MSLLQFIPGKVWLAVGAIALALAAGGWLRWDAVQDERLKDRETTIQREKDISDAVKDSDAADNWRDQLRDRHQ